MHHTISKQTRTELLDALRQRYQRASKPEKAKILDEFVAVAGCHRKHAIRLLTDTRPAAAAPAVGRRTYDEAVREALIVLWEAADRICGKRLKAVLPSLITALEKHGHLDLNPMVRQRLLAISPATIDRLLVSVRGTAFTRKKRKTATKPSKQVPVRTFADWNEPSPGYLEIDFVSHGGSSMHGAFLWSLVATDVSSGWTEAVPLLAREQSLVVEGLEVIRRQFPIPVLGIDSDNDSAFINDTLLAYCQDQRLVFTRSRAYQKNDQAWIEQKNGAVVRRFVGYDRLAGVVAGQCLAQLYQGVRLYVNYFQPSFKLRSKTRTGAKVKKVYHKPITPCERLLGHAAVAETFKEKLRAERDRLDPLELLHRIREGQAALTALGSGELGGGPGRESLEQFLAKLPDLWRAGEARPTHRKHAAQPRTWRTRKDPFEGVWPEILLWLQEDPEATAKSLFERLHRHYPGRFTPGQLRTLQRRIREWRRALARELVYTCLGEKETAAQPVVIGVGGGAGPREPAEGEAFPGLGG
ncbi:MAG TPA: transposase family protein [Candidatus Binatia bacterium]|nr:transposase family protein [Candidatus Binatia bacterium]